jgi:hypothetical protein
MTCGFFVGCFFFFFFTIIVCGSSSSLSDSLSSTITGCGFFFFVCFLKREVLCMLSIVFLPIVYHSFLAFSLLLIPIVPFCCPLPYTYVSVFPVVFLLYLQQQSRSALLLVYVLWVSLMDIFFIMLLYL